MIPVNPNLQTLKKGMAIYMKRFTRLLSRIEGLTKAVSRFPLTTVFLMASTVILAVAILKQKYYSKQLWACFVGALICAVFQVLYQRFFEKKKIRLLLMGGGILLSLGYYLILQTAQSVTLEIRIRTIVALIALFFAFIWIPVFRSRYSFNESFMVVFKSFFLSVFYSTIIFGGCTLIFVAIDALIVRIPEKSYMYMADFVFVLFAPVFFLSLIPIFPGKTEENMEENEIILQEEILKKASGCPRFLDVLISYIIIPLTAAYTVILVLYVFLNIRGEFWTNNLLEPLLVSYSLIVILVYILSSRLENTFAGFFRKVFPKILIPIVLFQIVSSVLNIGDTGIIHTRYYVILFGIFAVLSGLVMSIFPVRNNGIIAALLMGFSLISIIPPVDAFTISRISQTGILESVLERNGMLSENGITANSELTDADKAKIVDTVEYLAAMGYTEKISWFPPNFSIYEDFSDTFGFDQFGSVTKADVSVYVYRKALSPIDISGYDFLFEDNVSTGDSGNETYEFSDAKGSYTIEKQIDADLYDLVLKDKNNIEIIRFNTADIFQRYENYVVANSELKDEDAVFTVENDKAKMTLLIKDAGIYGYVGQTNYNSNYYILIQMK